MGRKTKCRPDVWRPFVRAVQMDPRNEATARNLVGITASTVRNWAERGKEGEEPYAEFWEEYRAAKSKMRMRLLTRLNEASESGDTNSTRWLLEKYFPKDFGSRVTLAIEATTVDKVIGAILDAAGDQREEIAGIIDAAISQLEENFSE